MSKDVLMFQQIHDNVINTYHRAAKQGVAGTHLPRGNFSDVCKVLSGLFIVDILDTITVELNVNGEDLNLIFSIKGEEE